MAHDLIWPWRSTDEANRMRMRSIPLFVGLEDHELDLLDSILTEIPVNVGKHLTESGAVGREFAIILEGLASVVRGDIEIARLGPHTFFGEHAPLTGEPRTADIIALTPMRLLVAGQQEFDRMQREIPKVGERIAAKDRFRHRAMIVSAAPGM